MTIPTLCLWVKSFTQNRNEFVRPVVYLNDEKWYLISKQVFVQPVLLGRQHRHDRMLYGEKSLKAAQRVVSNFFGDIDVKHYIPTQSCVNFGGLTTKRLHWPVAVVLPVSFEELSNDIRAHLSVIDKEDSKDRAVQELLKKIKKEFEPRLENLKQVAATVAA